MIAKTLIMITSLSMFLFFYELRGNTEIPTFAYKAIAFPSKLSEHYRIKKNTSNNKHMISSQYENMKDLKSLDDDLYSLNNINTTKPINKIIVRLNQNINIIFYNTKKN